MDADFANVFVQKQKEIMNDLLARVVMLEASKSLAESKLGDLSQTNSQLADELARMRDALTEQMNKVRELESDLADSIKKVLAVKAELAAKEDELTIAADDKKTLMKQLTEANVQKGILQTKLNTYEPTQKKS